MNKLNIFCLIMIIILSIVLCIMAYEHTTFKEGFKADLDGMISHSQDMQEILQRLDELEEKVNNNLSNN